MCRSFNWKRGASTKICKKRSQSCLNNINSTIWIIYFFCLKRQCYFICIVIITSYCWKGTTAFYINKWRSGGGGVVSTTNVTLLALSSSFIYNIIFYRGCGQCGRWLFAIMQNKCFIFYCPITCCIKTNIIGICNNLLE